MRDTTLDDRATEAVVCIASVTPHVVARPQLSKTGPFVHLMGAHESVRAHKYDGAMAPSALRVSILRGSQDLLGLPLAPDFGAILPSARLLKTMTANLASGGIVVAASHADVLVGYATIVSFDTHLALPASERRRWDGLENVLELGALEVARSERRCGVGTAIVNALSAVEALDDAILVGTSLVSHWDVRFSGLRACEYRRVLVRLLKRASFRMEETDDPEITEHPLNFLAVRVGRNVPAASLRAFAERLTSNGVAVT